MHLRKSDEALRSGVTLDVDAEPQTNGTPKNSLHNDSYANRDVEAKDEAEMSIDEQELEVVIDKLLASWALLVQRYQRDAFNTFTWGVVGGKDAPQCVPAGELDTTAWSTAADVLDKVRTSRSQKVDLGSRENTTFFFNNGTMEEWSFEVSIEYKQGKLRCSSRWQPPTMSDFQAAAHFRSYTAIVRTIFHDLQTKVSDIDQVSEDELETIWRWSTPLPEASAICIHDIISQKAELHPDKFAIEAWDGNLTYSEVDRYSTNLAQNLLLLDSSANQIIPVLFEKSRWTTVAVLAVMKAGACFALLDPAQPEGRLRAITQQINATLLIASERQTTLGARVAPGATIIPVSETKLSKIHSPFAERQPSTTVPAVSPVAPMYIQFTSGSTGQPKGCIITHSQYTSGAIPRAHCVGYRTHSRVLDFASYAFDVCIDSMLCTLSCGATLCTLSDEQRMNDLSGAMRDMRVTLSGMTPSVARTLDKDILPTLESIAVGGEGISASDATAWRKLTTVVNCYGPSECTVGATYNNTVGTKPYISMGAGMGCVVWITDPNNHNILLPPGAVGELLIEGPIVGNGYLNNPAKTNEVFIEDPEFLLAGSKTIPGRHGRLYKTGDLVSYDPDGNGEVIFVGRQDQQVKLRGQRIELAEIEYNMQKHIPSDAQLAIEVIKPAGGTGEQTLVAFLVEQKKSGMRHLDGDVFASFSNKFQAALQEMTKRLFEDLPAYMVPSAYIPLWKMPLLVSCKTDRKRLREIGTAITRKDLRRFSAAMSEKTQPTTEAELKLGKLWAKVLGGDADFSANDNFFSMGGDSLRAMKLVAATREDGLALSVPDIMLNPTLSAMAGKAKVLAADELAEITAFSLLPKDWDAEQAKVESAQLCGVEAEAVEDVYPCTPLQEGLMALSAKFQDAYVAQRILELPIEAAEKLMKAFDKVAKDALILRTRIVNVPGHGLFQVVLKDGQLARDHGSDVVKYLEVDRAEPMELGKALFRYGIIRDPKGETANIAITMHHAIYDGWSMPLVFERTDRAFNGLDTSRTATFKNFIKFLSQLDPAVSKDYWSQRLENTSPHQFPPLPSKGYITRADSLLEHYVNVPTTAHSRLTLATIIRSAWALVSSLYMGHTDIVFGETLTGRTASVSGIEQIEGPMITTVPIRVQLNFGRPISEFLQTVHGTTVNQIPHEHLGLQNIRRLNKGARIACELRTGLVLHPKEDEIPEGNNTDLSPASRFLPTDDAEAAREALKFNTYALMLVCTLHEDGFLVMASFDSNCISSPAMEKVLKVLDRVVNAFLGNPESKLGDVAVLDESELQNALEFRPKESMVDSMEPQMNGFVQEVAPGGGSETLSPNVEKLQDLLSRILGISKEEVNPTDSFFELGGDSISAMRLVSEARSVGLTISVAQIFQSSSLNELASSIGNEKVEKLISLLSRILNIPQAEIKVEDSFFELGGDSIGAMRLVPEARAQGLGISVAQIFQSTSISELASLAEKTASTAKSGEVKGPFAALGKDAHLFSADRIQPMLENPEWNVVDIYPVRPLQKIAVEGTVTLPRYSLRYELIKFEAAVDRAKLSEACQDVVQRNEVLRTLFVESEGQTLGVVVDTLHAPYTEVTVPEDAKPKDFIQDFINQDIQADKPYGSSFAAFTVFTTAGGKSTLAFRISHAQYDEMCLPLVFQQLAALYAGTSVPETKPFTNHVNHVVNRNIPESTPYWQNLLAGSSMSLFEPDIPLKDRKSTAIYREFDISSRPAGITIGSLPTAAWAVVLARRLSVRDVVFGEVVTGRNIGVEAADRVVGPTWQYAPFRVRFAPAWTYADLLRSVQQQHVESAAHEGPGLPEIVKECTDWDAEQVTWFDSVVHQAPVEWVEKLDFAAAGGEKLEAQFETLYPHQEPLREWKCQAFVLEGGKRLGIEIVTFEEWKQVGEEVISEVGDVLGALMEGKAGESIFEAEGAEAVKEGGVEKAAQLEDFEGVM